MKEPRLAIAGHGNGPVVRPAGTAGLTSQFVIAVKAQLDRCFGERIGQALVPQPASSRAPASAGDSGEFA